MPRSTLFLLYNTTSRIMTWHGRSSFLVYLVYYQSYSFIIPEGPSQILSTCRWVANLAPCNHSYSLPLYSSSNLNHSSYISSTIYFPTLPRLMKLIINTSQLRFGGATQVAYSLITEFKRFPHISFHVFLGTGVALIDKSTFPDNFVFMIPSSIVPIFLRHVEHNRLSC